MQATAIPLFWGEPLGFCVGFTPVVNAETGVTVEPAVPLLSDDGCEPERAGCFFSGDDLIVAAVSAPLTPVEHPTQGELWPAPDSLLFRSQAELNAWLADMGL